MDVHRASFPAPLGVPAPDGLTQRLVEFNSLVWKVKKDQGIPLPEPVAGIEIPAELQPLAPDLVAMHKLQ